MCQQARQTEMNHVCDEIHKLEKRSKTRKMYMKQASKPTFKI